MHHLLQRKIIVLVSSFVFCSTASVAQLRDVIYQDGHDDKPYHFGINVGYNKSHFNITHHPSFLLADTIMDVESDNSVGINLAWLVNMRLSNHFDLRVHPLDLTFTEENLLYREKYAEDSITEKKVQSITMSFPFQVAFSSDRIGNFKVYTILGGNFSYDLASNAAARKAEDLVKLRPYNFSAEIGMGFHIYFPYFVLSPEIKLGDGLVNLHSRDPNLRYSRVLDKINSRMVTFSLTVE